MEFFKAVFFCVVLLGASAAVFTDFIHLEKDGMYFFPTGYGETHIEIVDLKESH